jgi:hypothetical protein
MIEHITCTICGEKKEKSREYFYLGRRQCIPCYKKRNKKNKPDKHITELELGLENMSITNGKTFPKIFDHPGFKLIHVDEIGARLVSLSDPIVRNDVGSRGYRCISHCWGDVTNSLWKNHNVDGIEYEIFVREEKRNAFLQIFKQEGYWWIDLFCINQKADSKDKPLEIMGDIYSKCVECLCLLDCDDTSVKIVAKYAKKILNGEKIKEFALHFGNVLSSGWFLRVWTLQEVVSAPKSVMISENFVEWNTIDTEEFLEIYTKVYDEKKSWASLIPIINEIHHDVIMIRELRSFVTDEHMIADIVLLLRILCKSKRLCSEYVDYFYGSAHMFYYTDIIPWGLDDDKVWEYFVKSLNESNIFITHDWFEGRKITHEIGKFTTLGNIYSRFRTWSNLALLEPYYDDDIFSEQSGKKIEYALEIVDIFEKQVDRDYKELFIVDDDDDDSDDDDKPLFNHIRSQLPLFDMRDYRSDELDFMGDMLHWHNGKQTCYTIRIGNETRRVERNLLEMWILRQSGHRMDCPIITFVNSHDLAGYWIYLTENKLIMSKKKLSIGDMIYDYNPVYGENIMLLVDIPWEKHVDIGFAFPEKYGQCERKCKQEQFGSTEYWDESMLDGER